MAAKQTHLINWVGGKRLLRKTICPLIPSDIKSYIEPFGGGAWILFAKEKWANLEVYNDIDNRLVNLFRIVKYHNEALIKELRYMLNSRKQFIDYLKVYPLTDIQKAAQFMYVITRSFGAKGETYGARTNGYNGAMLSLNNMFKRIDNIYSRLDNVSIEDLSFVKCIKKYDRKTAFFYCDPPYTSGTGFSVVSTKDFDHTGLKEILSGIQGRFLLSYDDSEMVRDLYKDFYIKEVSRNSTLNAQTNNTQYKELLIANYNIFHS